MCLQFLSISTHWGQSRESNLSKHHITLLCTCVSEQILFASSFILFTALSSAPTLQTVMKFCLHDALDYYYYYYIFQKSLCTSQDQRANYNNADSYVRFWRTFTHRATRCDKVSRNHSFSPKAAFRCCSSDDATNENEDSRAHVIHGNEHTLLLLQLMWYDAHIHCYTKSPSRMIHFSCKKRGMLVASPTDKKDYHGNFIVHLLPNCSDKITMCERSIRE